MTARLEPAIGRNESGNESGMAPGNNTCLCQILLHWLAFCLTVCDNTHMDNKRTITRKNFRLTYTADLEFTLDTEFATVAS